MANECDKNKQSLPVPTSRRFPPELTWTHHEGLSLFEPTRVLFSSPTEPQNVLYEWESRRHRKVRKQRRLLDGKPPARASAKFFGWQPRSFSYWTAISFFLGAVFFTFSYLMAILPFTHKGTGATSRMEYMSNIESLIAATCFIFGTSFQFLEVINDEREVDLTEAWKEEHDMEADVEKSPEELRQKAKAETRWMRFLPHRIDYWAAVIMWIGSLVFEVNSVLSTIPVFSASIVLARKWVWSFSLAGASVFVISGYMQYVEAVHGFAKWKPRSLGFWSTVFGTLGGVFFALPSITGFWSNHLKVLWWGSNLGFFIGSCCFLANGYCLILERVNR